MKASKISALNNIFHRKSPVRLADMIVFLLTILLLWMHLCHLFLGVIKADDWEHLSAAWFIFNGYIPYLDFFQHHNPLLWYILAPFFYVLKDPFNAFYVGRTISALFFLGSLYFIWKMMQRLGYSAKAYLYAVFVYLLYPVSHLNYPQNRPDTPMIFFLLAGFYYWTVFYQSKKNRHIIFCYLCFFISFAFLQKAILFLAPFGIYQLYLLFKKQLKWGQVLLAAVMPLTITFAYGIYLWHHNLLLRYWELNWILNAHFFRNYRMYTITIYDYVFGIGGVALTIIGIIRCRDLKRHLLSILLTFEIIFLMIPKPYDYYWFIWTPFVSVVLGIVISKIKSPYQLELLLPAMFGAIILFVRIDVEDAYHLKTTQYVHSIMSPEDRVITYGLSEFALLSDKPEHYYYINLSRAAPLDIDLFHRHQLPDWDTIVKRDKPRFVAYFQIYNVQHLPDWHRDRFLMGIDKSFLEQYYTRITDKKYPLWMRKD